MLHIFLLPGADSTPQIRFQTAAAILAAGQRLLSLITCRRLWIMRSEITSWLLHWPAAILLAGSKNRVLLLLAGDFPAF